MADATLRDAKISLMVLIGLLTLASSLAPWLLHSVFRQHALDRLNLLSAFAAGLVFAAFLCHMVPDASEKFASYLAAAYAGSPGARLPAFPFAPFLAGLVCAGLVALDRLVVAHGSHGGDGVSDGGAAPAAPHEDHITAALQSMQRAVQQAGSGAPPRPLQLPPPHQPQPSPASDADAAARRRLRRRKSEAQQQQQQQQLLLLPGAAAAAAAGPSLPHGHSHGTGAAPHHHHSHHGAAAPHLHTHTLCLEGHRLGEAAAAAAALGEEGGGEEAEGSSLARPAAAAQARYAASLAPLVPAQQPALSLQRHPLIAFPSSPQQQPQQQPASAADAAAASAAAAAAAAAACTPACSTMEVPCAAPTACQAVCPAEEPCAGCPAEHEGLEVRGDADAGADAGASSSPPSPLAAAAPPSAPASAQLLHEKVRRAWVFFLALSVHSLLDGLSLGSETSVAGFYSLLIAVVAHKAFDGIALGVPVYQARLPGRTSAALLAACAAATPLGIGLGWALTAGAGEGGEGGGSDAEGALPPPSAGELTQAVIISLSSGSFLYISLVELLPAALADGRSTRARMAAFVVGYVAMGALAAYA